MPEGNHSTVTEFILSGLTEKPELQLPLFFFFLGTYFFTVVGNLGMIVLILLSSHLQTPMYFFLSSLSFIDLCYSTVITPRMLVNFVTQKKAISYSGCMTQLYFYIGFVVSECYMLAAMAYDRFIAICNPLLYNAVMSYQVCSWMVGGVYATGFTEATVENLCVLRAIFCKANVINHYFCDLLPLLKLACTSTLISEITILCLSVMNSIVPTLTIMSSYTFIIVRILRIKSTEGRFKAFSTCSSHFCAVAVFFGSLVFVYLQPSSVSSKEQGKVSSVFYTTVVPMLNPLIYSLRNRDVKLALSKLLCKRHVI